MKLPANISAYIELTKPRILYMVLVTTTLGYYLGGRGILSSATLIYLLLGAGLVCGGSGVLNNFLERESDCKMSRTKNRAIPSGIISPANALNFGLILILGGLVVLYLKVNLLTAFLSLVTSFLYVLVYTPMKKISWLNTTIGSIPGAIPPMGGWAAATSNLDVGAWVLFFILFLWQHPHFYAIAWMYRDDYSLGGFKMLPVIEPDGQSTFRQIICYSLLLIPISLLPYFLNLSGPFYLIGAFVLGITLFWVGKNLTKSKSILDARRLLKTSVVYLPVLLILIILDTTF